MERRAVSYYKENYTRMNRIDADDRFILLFNNILFVRSPSIKFHFLFSSPLGEDAEGDEAVEG